MEERHLAILLVVFVFALVLVYGNQQPSFERYLGDQGYTSPATGFAPREIPQAQGSSGSAPKVRGGEGIVRNQQETNRDTSGTQKSLWNILTHKYNHATASRGNKEFAKAILNQDKKAMGAAGMVVYNPYASSKINEGFSSGREIVSSSHYFAGKK